MTFAHHGPGVLPFGQLVQDPQQVDAGEQIPPAELIVVSSLLECRDGGQKEQVRTGIRSSSSQQAVRRNSPDSQRLTPGARG